LFPKINAWFFWNPGSEEAFIFNSASIVTLRRMKRMKGAITLANGGLVECYSGTGSQTVTKKCQGRLPPCYIWTPDHLLPNIAAA
jgi:hypothetical protein